ncbi:MAG: tannase/feruloyl esterase family alpha/beta hydrolase [Novosphingobium sp.]|nr:tannase/feruloyl esterase family alpha/beta hydrolase [Novosphingobium sp.]
MSGNANPKGMSLILLAAVSACASPQTVSAPGEASALISLSVERLRAMCETGEAQAAAAGLSTAITLKPVPTTLFNTATQFVAARGDVPAFCQVSGSFVTNPETGRTANFLATFPANWNGKYLQSGCSGHCGQFFVNNPAMPTFNVTGQGEAFQAIRKGYAHFATDQGHQDMDFTKWAVRKDGSVDSDAIADWAWRADKVLAKVGKEYATAFYARASGEKRAIARSYFNGCSGGGRDALVKASYMPNEFDGIIAGSPYDPVGVALHGAAVELVSKRAPDAVPNPAQLLVMDGIVKAQCDGLDGVNDGIIQNPAACDFRPERDLPLCGAGKTGDTCFTRPQIETISVSISALTDETGRVIQPGYSVSEFQQAYMLGLQSGAVQKVFALNNDPATDLGKLYTFRSGGPGTVTNFHAVIPASHAARIRGALEKASGHQLDNWGPFMGGKTKLLLWHNLSDEALTPYMSYRLYKGLASKFGGYARLQEHARFFTIPGTSHCSISGEGPNSFDALGAMEAWVERVEPPEALRTTVVHRQFTPGAPKAAAAAFPNWTGLLCKFPEMARYKGTGDTKDAANWVCASGDKRMLTVGESGRQAGF